MRRAIFVALGIGAIVTSAAAIGFTAAGMPEPATSPATDSHPSLTQMRQSELSARDAQRAKIEDRYQAERARCEALRGIGHDRCIIAAHAHRGRALLEAAAPYQRRG
jgi:hypothetical protein